MLKTLHIGNFKAFAETQRVPIRPLTLIFGPNSAGKSSILQSLLLFHEIESQSRFEMEIDDLFGPTWKTCSPDLNVVYPRLSGKSVDLGGWKSYVHKRNPNSRVTLGLEFDLTARVIANALMDLTGDYVWAQKPDYPHIYTLLEKFKTIAFQVGFGPDTATTTSADHSQSLAVQTAEINLDGEWLLRLRKEGMQYGRQHSLGVEGINLQHPLIRACKLNSKQRKVLKDLKSNYECLVTFLPEMLQEENVTIGPQPGDPVGQVLLALRRAAKAVVGSMDYLGGIRIMPPRFLAALDRNHPDFYSAGIDAWKKLLVDNELRQSVNDWLTKLDMGHSVQVHEIGNLEALKSAAKIRRKEGELSQLKQLQRALKSSLAQSTPELFLLHRNSQTLVNHRDVGVGLSQILPVLVRSLGSKEKTILVEQPEIHVHPKLQAELGDVFIESALGKRKNTFLLETHSEHLMLRIMRRIRETHLKMLPKGCSPITEKDVSVLFVEPEGSKSICREMPINELGEFVKAWPGGFFEESYRELFP